MERTKWQLHVDRWRHGCGNALCDRAQKVCLARGSLPCDVLFTAEAPGESENVVGRPMVGPCLTLSASFATTESQRRLDRQQFDGVGAG